MKLTRRVVFASAAIFAATTCVVSPLSTSAQESDQSTGAQTSDVWGNQGLPDSAADSDTEVNPDDSTPDSNPPLTVTGDWVGNVADNMTGDSSFTATFTQKKGKLMGTWDTFQFSGTLVGSVTSHSAKITFTFYPEKPYPHCHFILTSTSASDSEIMGTYKFAECDKASKKEHGTIDISPAP
jgi:hypothetical protein